VGHKKLVKFAALKTFENVLEFPENMKGNWHEHFGNNNPIVLELACGRGEYTVGMAQNNSSINYIGIDRKGNRMFNGAKKSLELGLKNAAFLRISIEQLTDYFAPNEISNIWIIFPDPFLRDGKAKNRLTHYKFLYAYQQVLRRDGSVNLKTDSPILFDFTNEVVTETNCKVLQKIENIYSEGEAAFPLSIKTYYEGLHLADNRIIKYIQFQLPQNAIKIPPKKKVITDDSFLQNMDNG
jgi:tRNA (guanine-N7-)-methyltransferase